MVRRDPARIGRLIYRFVISIKHGKPLFQAFSETYTEIDGFWARLWARIHAFRTPIVAALGPILTALIIMGIVNAILSVAGKVVTDIHADNTTRYKNEGDAGNRLADTTVRGSTNPAHNAPMCRNRKALGDRSASPVSLSR
jgi:hypothetical protein